MVSKLFPTTVGYEDFWSAVSDQSVLNGASGPTSGDFVPASFAKSLLARPRHENNFETTSMKFPELQHEVECHFSRSSGPGGQNVNKTNTKVLLRWNVASSRLVPEEVKRRFIEQNHHRMTEEGDFFLQVERHRSQKQNYDEAIDHLQDLISRAWRTPKKRVKTKPTRSSRETRLKSKRLHSIRKKERSRKGHE